MSRTVLVFLIKFSLTWLESTSEEPLQHGRAP